MNFLRKAGMSLSLSIMQAAHAARYFSAPKKRGAIAGVRVIVLHGSRVLLVSHWYAPGVWTLPGGGVKKSEDPAEAAKREVFEETGLKIESVAGEVGTYRGRLGIGDSVRVYFAESFEGSLARKPNFEIMARSWFDMDHLPEEISPANLRRIKAYQAGARKERKRW